MDKFQFEIIKRGIPKSNWIQTVRTFWTSFESIEFSGSLWNRACSPLNASVAEDFQINFKNFSRFVKLMISSPNVSQSKMNEIDEEVNGINSVYWVNPIDDNESVTSSHSIWVHYRTDFARVKAQGSMNMQIRTCLAIVLARHRVKRG